MLPNPRSLKSNATVTSLRGPSWWVLLRGVIRLYGARCSVIEYRNELGGSRTDNRLPVRLGLSSVWWASLALIASMHVYEVRPRKDHCGVDLISKLPPPTPRRCEGRLFQPEQSWKSSRILDQPPSPRKSGNTPDLCVSKSLMLPSRQR